MYLREQAPRHLCHLPYHGVYTRPDHHPGAKRTAPIRVRLLLRLLFAVFAVVHECPFIVIETEGGSLDGHGAFMWSMLAVNGVHAEVITGLNHGRFGFVFSDQIDEVCAVILPVR